MLKYREEFYLQSINSIRFYSLSCVRTLNSLFKSSHDDCTSIEDPIMSYIITLLQTLLVPQLQVAVVLHNSERRRACNLVFIFLNHVYTPLQLSLRCHR